MKLEFALEDADLDSVPVIPEDSEADIQGTIAGVDVALEGMASVSKIAAILRARNVSQTGTRIGLIATEGIRKRLKIGHIKPLETAVESYSDQPTDYDPLQISQEFIGTILKAIWDAIVAVFSHLWKWTFGRLTSREGKSNSVGSAAAAEARKAAIDTMVAQNQQEFQDIIAKSMAKQANPAPVSTPTSTHTPTSAPATSTDFAKPPGEDQTPQTVQGTVHGMKIKAHKAPAAPKKNYAYFTVFAVKQSAVSSKDVFEFTKAYGEYHKTDHIAALLVEAANQYLHTLGSFVKKCIDAGQYFHDEDPSSYDNLSKIVEKPFQKARAAGEKLPSWFLAHLKSNNTYKQFIPLEVMILRDTIKVHVAHIDEHGHIQLEKLKYCEPGIADKIQELRVDRAVDEQTAKYVEETMKIMGHALQRAYDRSKNARDVVDSAMRDLEDRISKLSDQELGKKLSRACHVFSRNYAVLSSSAYSYETSLIDTFDGVNVMLEDLRTEEDFRRGWTIDYKGIATESAVLQPMRTEMAMEGIGGFLASVWKAICDALASIWNFLTGKTSSGGGGGSAARDKDMDKTEEAVKQTVQQAQAAKADPKKKEAAQQQQAQAVKTASASAKDQATFNALSRAFRSDKAVISDVLADIKLSEAMMKNVAFLVQEVKVFNTRVTAALEAYIQNPEDGQMNEHIKKFCEEFAQHVASHTKDLHDSDVVQAVRGRGHDDQHYGEVGILPGHNALLVYNETAGHGEHQYLRVRPSVVNAPSGTREYTAEPCTNPVELLSLTDSVKQYKDQLNKLEKEFEVNTAEIIKQQKNLRNRVDGLLKKDSDKHHPDQLRALHTVIAGALTYVEGMRQYLKAFDHGYKHYSNYLKIADQLGIVL